MWDGGLKDVQHAVARLVPGLERELLPVQDHYVLQAVGSRPCQLLIICRERKKENAVLKSANTKYGCNGTFQTGRRLMTKDGSHNVGIK